MKIINHGKILAFECKSCECKFVAGLHETTDCGFFFKTNCPECGSEVERKDIENKEDSKV